MSINVFLPCRKGSERVPRKNTKPIGRFANGLLELKLSQLLDTREIDRIFVSSNDDEVLGFAQSLKSAKIITHKRDENLCASSTSTDSLIAYAHELVGEGEILWTHVTSPFFGSKQYSEVIAQYRACLEQGYDSLMSVNALYGFLWDSSKPLNYDRAKVKWPQTQNLTPIFEVNSACFLANAQVYRTQEDRIGQKPYLYITDKITGFDVDWQEDFAIAQALLESTQSQRANVLGLSSFGGGVIAYKRNTQSFHLYHTNTPKSNNPLILNDTLDSRESIVCSHSRSNGGLAHIADSNLPQNLAYRKDVCLERLDDAPTPSRALDSKKFLVCTRSGASGNSLATSDNKFAEQTCNKIMECVA
ncbi:MAG TPA: hypothetical protein IAA33_03655 [Candidatus Helicobacter avicola]|nr:hypothetical protein [Candidatus Helicobacter avicola]